MPLYRVLYYLLVCIIHTSRTSFVFHENINIMFKPTSLEYANAYFGYSTILTPDGLYVGAPKAGNVMNERTGAIFLCNLKQLDEKLVLCDYLDSSRRENNFISLDLKDDVLFGASVVYLGNHNLLVSAPRTKTLFNYKHLMLLGTTYFLTPRGYQILNPLSEGVCTHQIFISNGTKIDYMYGQAGFSMAVTKNNSVIMGVPGLFQWRGGVVSYKFNPNASVPYDSSQPVVNLYIAKELSPDDYLGYSVESGTFEKNGEELYVASAPRSQMGAGKVLVFNYHTLNKKNSLDIRAVVIGPQDGSYFGASLCCTDINNDGMDDLLVGAPTFVQNNKDLPYDQGAVFIYITKESKSGFTLEKSGFVSGSAVDGARFGTTIADLGDVNGDGFNGKWRIGNSAATINIAVGAPWEDGGKGAVYIYMGDAKGLREKNVQRIQASDARGFGLSIAKGFDVDNNNCNDLAVGAYDSGASYLYRCIPSMPVHARIIVPPGFQLPHNEATFTVRFCIIAPPIKFRKSVSLDVIAKMMLDPDDKRAELLEDSTYRISVSPENDICQQNTIHVDLTADLFKPLLIKFKFDVDELMKDDATKFNMNAARLSDDSTLETSVLVPLMRNCGTNLFCSPNLIMTLDALNNPYVPGTNDTFGINLKVKNLGEPAYGFNATINLPSHPKRIPSECSLRDLIMTCDLPQPFLRNDTIEWKIELKYNLNATDDVDLMMTAKLSDKFQRYNITDKFVKDLVLKVSPEASFIVNGKSVPNATMSVWRDSLYAGANVLFDHSFRITNLGPSDWPALSVQIQIPEKTKLSSPIEGCDEVDNAYECLWQIQVKASLPITIPLVMDLSIQGDFLKEITAYNATSLLRIRYKNKYVNMFNVTTTLNLEPASITWHTIVPCIFVGLLLLGIIVRILHKYGFFQRKKYELLQREKKNQQSSRSEKDINTNNIDLKGEGSCEDLLRGIS